MLTPHTRRVFLQRGMTLVSAALTVPTFIDSTVWAMDDPIDSKRTQQNSGIDGKILVVVQLSGGNDGLNTVIPYADDAYQAARPVLAKRGDKVLKINNYLGLNPNLPAIKEMYDQGMASILQGVGYPNPNRSHFRSMDIWHSGVPEKEMVTSGWLGRYFDNTCTGADPHAGVCIGESAPLVMTGEKIKPLSFEKPQHYRYNGKDIERYKSLNRSEAAAEPPKQPGGKAAKAPKVITPGSQLEFITRTAMDAQVSSDKILDLVSNYQTPA
ncbi:MAG TPA: hypothetical protein VGB55_13075, partial [Tepidisphaeraceae bacterium]